MMDLAGFYKDKDILVTGGCGSIGSEIVRHLLKFDVKRVRIFDHNETGMFWFIGELDDKRVRALIGDVRDRNRLRLAMHGVDVVFHCTPKGTPIITSKGVKNIENIVIGDKVIDMNGNFESVTSIMNRCVREEVVNIETSLSNISQQVTSGHPILVWSPSKKCPYSSRTFCNPSCSAKKRRDCPLHFQHDSVDWVDVAEIKKGDFVAYPRMKVDDNIERNDLYRLFGYFLAEGSFITNKKYGEYGVRFSFNNNEFEYINDVMYLCHKHFDKIPSLEFTKFNSCNVVLCGKDIAARFLMFGKGASNKKIPSFVFNQCQWNIEQLLRGYFNGDGCYSEGKMSTVSKDLAYQLRLLFNALGIVVSLKKYKKNVSFIRGRRIKSQICYEVSLAKNFDFKSWKMRSLADRNKMRYFVTDDYIFVRVKSVSRRMFYGKVYNFSVDMTESYTINGFVCHNCAALKHVPLCEYNPSEAVKTNADGTQNVIDSARKEGVGSVLYISTDKAVNPVSTMGATKLLGEKLIMNAAFGDSKTKFSCVRFGNVVNSSGSVIPVFKEQIFKGGPVTVTSEKMTRFFMSISEAVDLVLKCVISMQGHEIFILRMKALRIMDLANVLIEELSKDVKIKIIGIRPSEKLYEALLAEEELHHVEELDDMFVVHPPIDVPHFVQRNESPVISGYYNSGNMPLISMSEIRDMLKKEKII